MRAKLRTLAFLLHIRKTQQLALQECIKISSPPYEVTEAVETTAATQTKKGSWSNGHQNFT
jgi:hypothetical protein